MLNALVINEAFASVALTVKLKVPVVVGVPLMMPVEAFSDRPVGSAPVVIDQVYGARPLLAARVWL